MKCFNWNPGDEYESFWCGFRFKAHAKEEQFLNRYMNSVVICCQIWSMFNFLSSIFILVHRPIPRGVGVSHIPGLAVCVIACVTFLLLSLPRLVKHAGPYAVLILSIATVLVTLCQSVDMHIQAEVNLLHAPQGQLRTIYEQVYDDPEALEVLRFFLREKLTWDMYSLYIVQSLLTLLPLTMVGFFKSTFFAIVLMPSAGLFVAVVSPVMLTIYALMFVIFHVLFSVLVVGLSIVLSMTRRSQFSIEHSFELRLKEELEASRQADSILNHTLKNTMADAAGEIEMFLEKTACAPSATRHLQQSSASLRRGMRSCRHRQAYLNLVMHRYMVSLRPVQLLQFGNELTRGRNIRLSVKDLVVCIDVTLCGLILDNAISNAFKHGHPTAPDVTFTITDAAPAASPSRALVQEQVQLAFVVTNKANPARPPLTQEYIDLVRSGKPVPSSAVTTSAMSDQIGLQHSFLAAEAHGIELSIRQVGDQVTFEAHFRADVSEMVPDARDEARAADLDAFPADLHVYCIDDSATARRLLEHNLRLRARTANVHLFGEYETDADAFVCAALTDGDVAILDQHLEYGGHSNILGTDIVRQLVVQGFKGLVCIRSGNVTPQDQAQYFQAGAHCVFGKDAGMRQVMDDMKVAYVRRILYANPAAVRSDVQERGRTLVMPFSSDPLPEPNSALRDPATPPQSSPGRRYSVNRLSGVDDWQLDV